MPTTATCAGLGAVGLVDEKRGISAWINLSILSTYQAGEGREGEQVVVVEPDMQAHHGHEQGQICLTREIGGGGAEAVGIQAVCDFLWLDGLWEVGQSPFVGG